MKVGKNKSVLLVVVAFLVFPACFSVPEAKAACTANDFCYRMPITVDSTQVSNGPLYNFPFLFSTTNNTTAKNSLKAHVKSASGDDIIFRALDTTTCQGTAPCTLSHEIEKWDSTTGELVAWVKVPSIQSTNPATTIYVYYGNSATIPQEPVTDVWNDGNYRGVYHFPNGTSLTLTDSSTLANNLTNYGLAAETSKIDGGAVDNGSSYAVAGSPAITGNTQLTVEAWVKVANGYSAYSDVCGQYYNSSIGAFDLYMEGGWIGLYIYNGGATATRWASSLINDGNWHHVAGVFYGSSYLDMYVDGALSDYTPLTGSIPPWTNSSTGVPLMVGASSSGGTPTGFLTGSVDEIRVSWYARSADWIATEYNNQCNPDGIVSCPPGAGPKDWLRVLYCFPCYHLILSDSYRLKRATPDRGA